jgi:hypothetical protein
LSFQGVLQKGVFIKKEGGLSFNLGMLVNYVSNPNLPLSHFTWPFSLSDTTNKLLLPPTQPPKNKQVVNNVSNFRDNTPSINKVYYENPFEQLLLSKEQPPSPAKLNSLLFTPTLSAFVKAASIPAITPRIRSRLRLIMGRGRKNKNNRNRNKNKPTRSSRRVRGLQPVEFDDGTTIPSVSKHKKRSGM